MSYHTRTTILLSLIDWMRAQDVDDKQIALFAWHDLQHESLNAVVDMVHETQTLTSDTEKDTA